MEEITLRFDDYSEEDVDKFLDDFRRHVFRCGG